MEKRTIPTTWIIPCNYRIFNLPACFEKYGHTYWNQLYDFIPGDKAFIYACRPYSAIRYSVEIEAADLPYDPIMDFKQQFYENPDSEEWKKVNRFALFRMTGATRSTLLTLDYLKEHGLKSAPRQSFKILQPKFYELNEYIELHFSQSHKESDTL